MNKLTKLNLIKALLTLRYTLDHHDAKWVEQLKEWEIINFKSLDSIVNEIKDKKDDEVAKFTLDEILMTYIAHDISLKMMFAEGSEISEKFYSTLGLDKMIPVNQQSENADKQVKDFLRQADQRLLQQIEKICKDFDEFHEVKNHLTSLEFD